MKQSESIVKISAALLKVHSDLAPIVKDRVNSHFKNSYATLDAIMDYLRPVLAAQGIVVLQGGAVPVSDMNGAVTGASVETMLLHESGEYLSSTLLMPIDKASPQAVGSAVTYGRRYGLAGMLSLTTEEDDDGNRAEASQMNAETTDTANRSASPACPKCGGECWDNRKENNARAEKGERLRPDWSCKDKGKCDGVIWRPK